MTASLPPPGPDDSKGIDGPARRRAPSRRPGVRTFLGALLASLIVFALALLQAPGFCHRHVPSRQHQAHGDLSLKDQARRILQQTPLLDGHDDLPFAIRMFFNDHIYADNFTTPFEKGGLPGQVDLARLRQGMSGGAFWSIFGECPKNAGDFSDGNYAAGIQLALRQVDLVTRLKQRYPDVFSPSRDSASAMESFRKGRLISPMGLEGLHLIGNSVATLRQFHALGVRYATLTHNCHNKFADAALLENPMRKAEPGWGGVSPLGRRLVREMNRMGMIVDLAHVSEDTMIDVLGGRKGWAGSEAPVMFSHSSAHAVCPHPRNVKDAVLRLVKQRNSVVMVNFSPEFISCVPSDDPSGLPEYFPANGTLAQVVRHIRHIGELVGFDHVGIGSDFDGIPDVPAGLEDVSKYPDLVEELLRQGLSGEDVAKVVGGNIMRVWGEVEAVAERMQAAGEPVMEDDIPPIRFLLPAGHSEGRKG